MDKNMIFSVSPVLFSTWWRVWLVGLGGGGAVVPPVVSGVFAVGFALAFCVFFKLFFKYLIGYVPVIYWFLAWRCFAKIRSKK